ncbi:MAG: Slp family lipoprotein [Thermodesulfovibrio sp.]|nr:Slp family lipoprotein [Thermodesulfovibrio sp.]
MKPKIDNIKFRWFSPLCLIQHIYIGKVRNIFIISFLLFITIYGCATLPKPLQDTPALRDVPFTIVKKNPDKYYDVSLLWGGRITSCMNTEEGTVFEILHLPLESDGYPSETDASEGRFIAKSKNFLDCAVYSQGRYLTVVGKFKGLKEGKIDQMPYTFPVIETYATYLWKKRVPSYRYPYWRPSFWFWYGSPRLWFEYGPW